MTPPFVCHIKPFSSPTLFKAGPMNRRDFILSSLAGTSLALMPGLGRAHSFFPTLPPDEWDMAPLERMNRYEGSSEIEGDTHDEAHEIFWDKDGYVRKKGGVPRVSAHYDVVIIGGGLAGLSAAHQLKNKKILLIEGHPRLGGNAKAQAFGNSYVSQGSAYVTVPEEGDEIDSFYRDLGLKSRFRQVDHLEEAVMIGGKPVRHFWQGESAPAFAQEFLRAKAKFKEIYENNYPELPIWDNSSSGRTYFNSLDTLTFSQWIDRELKGTHPHLIEFINLYCWSSFSAGAHEISAAQGLNFLSSDLAGTQVLPGGNGLIAQAIYEKLKKRSKVTLLSSSFALDVQSAGGKSIVCYKDRNQKLQTVSARHCIVSSPKMVAKKIISTLSRPQEKAMSDLSYRAYLVANVLLKKKISSPGYDLFTMKGSVPVKPHEESRDRVFTDIVFADWANRDSSDKSILTLYLPLPYTMAQQYLFVPGLYEKYQQRILNSLSLYLSGQGLSHSDVAGIRLVRYGHALPLAKVGGVSSGLFERASASIDGTIHFSNQDNWGNPCFETSFGSALEVTRKIL